MRWTEDQLREYELSFKGKTKKLSCSDLDEHEVPESTLQQKCEQWLRERGFHYLHDRSRKQNPPGMFLDLHIYLSKGRHVVCELKVKGNKMSQEQVKTYRKLMFLEHEVYEVRSFKRFLEIMNLK